MEFPAEDRLLASAARSRENALCRYSGFAVSAAIGAEDGSFSFRER